MARFYVGQRVRIIACDSDDPWDLSQVGKEAVVNSIECVNGDGKSGHIGVTICGDPDWCFLPHELEPITDSYDLVSWESMRELWVPEHLRTNA